MDAVTSAAAAAAAATAAAAFVESLISLQVLKRLSSLLVLSQIAESEKGFDLKKWQGMQIFYGSVGVANFFSKS